MARGQGLNLHERKDTQLYSVRVRREDSDLSHAAGVRVPALTNERLAQRSTYIVGARPEPVRSTAQGDVGTWRACACVWPANVCESPCSMGA